MRITVLGGKGLLGRHLTPLLEAGGHDVRVASRSTDPPTDLATGKGLSDAIEDADVVVHLASNAATPARVDIAGTTRLMDLLADQDRKSVV